MSRIRRLLGALLLVASYARAEDICPEDIDAIRSPGAECEIGDCSIGECLTVGSDGQVECGACATGAAPSNAQYLTLAADATLTVERVFTPAPGLACVDAGAGGTYTCYAIGLRTPGGTFFPTDNSISASDWLKIDAGGTLVGLPVVAHTLLNAGYHTDTNTTSVSRGQVIAANTVPEWAPVPVNATTTRKFLREVGDGVNANFPAWDTLIGSDVTDVACSDCITLTTETSGNYVATLTAGAGLTGTVASEGSTPTVAVGAGTCIAANADDVALATSCAQDETWTGAHDYSGARLEAPNATSTTGTDCDAAGEAGRVFIDTDEALGHKLKVCSGAGGWENAAPLCLSWVMYSSCVASGATNCSVVGAGCTQIPDIGSVGARSPAILVDFDVFTHCRLRYTGSTSGVQTGTVTVKLANYSTTTDDITTSFSSDTTCADRSSSATDLSANAGLDSVGVQVGDSTSTDDPFLSGVVLTCCTTSTVP